MVKQHRSFLGADARYERGKKKKERFLCNRSQIRLLSEVILVGYIRKCTAKFSIGIAGETNEGIEVNVLRLSRSTATRDIADLKSESGRKLNVSFPYHLGGSADCFRRSVLEGGPSQRACYHLSGSILPNLEAMERQTNLIRGEDRGRVGQGGKESEAEGIP
jgi:hypothetical protein